MCLPDGVDSCQLLLLLIAPSRGCGRLGAADGRRETGGGWCNVDGWVVSDNPSLRSKTPALSCVTRGMCRCVEGQLKQLFAEKREEGCAVQMPQPEISTHASQPVRQKVRFRKSSPGRRQAGQYAARCAGRVAIPGGRGRGSKPGSRWRGKGTGPSVIGLALWALKQSWGPPEPATEPVRQPGKRPRGPSGRFHCESFPVGNCIGGPLAEHWQCIGLDRSG